MDLDNAELELKLNELYKTNTIVRYAIEMGSKHGISNLAILAHTVITLAGINEELQAMLLKIEMERPIPRSIIL